jgi:phosphatidylglycerophosphate synthase
MDQGRKIPGHYEHPIDDVLIHFVEHALNPTFYSMGFTPNLLTTISLALGIFAAVAVWYNKYFIGATLFIISYVFDCADGNFARRYGMVTEFGDWYDHVSDVLKVLLLMCAIWFKKEITISTKIIFVIMVVILTFLCMVHMGCQEKLYDKEKRNSLSALENLCWGSPSQTILITRYFGCANLIFGIAFFVLVLGARKST